MATTLHPASERSKTAWSYVWSKVRTPLHKLISYSELILEEAKENSRDAIESQIVKLLNICEGILHHTKLNPDLAIAEGADPLREISAALLQQHSNLQAIADNLKLLSNEGLPEQMGKDIGIVCDLIASLKNTFMNLAVAPVNDRSPQTATNAKSTLPVSKSSTDPFIVQIEYLGLLLVVDDDEGNRDVLSRRLLRDGYEVMLAEGGRQALRMLNRYDFDMVLLDVMMPGMDGISVLSELKRNPKLNQLPVIMITAVDDVDSIVRCIEAGADDYLLKPFNPVLLRARIHALLDRKRLQDEQKRQHQELELILQNSRRQTERAEKMLLNILPPIVAEELSEHGSVKPMYFEDVTIVFADIVGFTLSTEQLPADELVEVLNDYFTRCDQIVARYGLEKMKTIGDCYMFAGGLPVRKPSHPVDSVLAAVEMIRAMAELSAEGKVSWQLRIGINTGPVIAGVVGIHKFAFDIWGDAVNFTSRVEACGSPGRINLSQGTYTRVKDFFSCEKRERVRVKEGKEVEMYFINGVAASLLNKPDKSPLEAFRGRYTTFFRKDLETYPISMFETGSTV